MEYSLSWEAGSFSASQEIPRWHCMEAEVSLPHAFTSACHLSLSWALKYRAKLEVLWNVSKHRTFYGKELPTFRLTPKLEDHPFLAVRDCSFNIFAATLLEIVLPHKTKVA